MYLPEENAAIQGALGTTQITMLQGAESAAAEEPVRTGWLPPMPDLRDYSDEAPEIAATAKSLAIADQARALPTKVDLRQWCSAIENQGSLGSCTANAAVGVVEYYERRAFGKHIDGSRLFVYKTTRNLLGWVGDTGAYLRTTMGALALCGVPPARFWSYTTNKQAGQRTFDEEPPSFVYALADNFEALRYFRHDRPGIAPPKTLASVKRWVAAGFPAMFGFYGFQSFNNTDTPGGIPFPCPGEQAVWGHAIVAVGYDDKIKIKNTRCNKVTTGAFLIRNSWGTGWGDGGYGWMPYEYVLNQFATDFWTLTRAGWVDTKQFGL